MIGSRCRRAMSITVLFGSITGWVVPGAVARTESGPEPKIIGGGPASPGEYPFMAAVLNESTGGDDYNKQYCGGSLIADSWVLTAAHCVFSRSPGSLAVAVGRTSLRSNEGQRVRVDEILIHPDYDDAALEFDAALLRLATPVTGIDPIQLAGAADDRFEEPGTPLTVIGWGSTSAKGQPSYPDHLQEVQVAAVSDAACTDAYGELMDGPTMVCAARAGADSCQGDSGGPLFADDAGRRIQVGIVSWGSGCAAKRYPGVYSEVNNAQIGSWIHATIQDDDNDDDCFLAICNVPIPPL